MEVLRGRRRPVRVVKSREWAISGLLASPRPSVLHAPNLHRMARGHCPRVKRRVQRLGSRFVLAPTPAFVEVIVSCVTLLGAEAVRPMADPAMITDEELAG